MKKGKKSLAYRLCYEDISKIEKSSERDPIQVVEEAGRYRRNSFYLQVEIQQSNRVQRPAVCYGCEPWFDYSYSLVLLVTIIVEIFVV